MASLIALLSPFLNFVAFLLLLLASLSLPIINSIYLFLIGTKIEVGKSIVSASADARVKFGVWGYCTDDVNAQVAVFDASVDGSCSKAKLGYKLDPWVETFLNISQGDGTSDIIEKGLTFVLVLHPIACSLIFLALVAAIVGFVRPGRSRTTSVFVAATASLATILTTIVFIVDIVLVSVVKSRVHRETSGAAYADYGSVPWLALVAMLCLWVGTTFSCYNMITHRTNRNKTTERY